MPSFLRIFAMLIALFTLSTNHAAANTESTQHQEAGLTVRGAWAPHTGKRTMSAAIYFTIQNDGTQDDTLVGVNMAHAEMTTLHRSYEEDSIMRMDHIEVLPIPSGGSVALAPGGYHIMLMQLESPLKRGTQFPLTLTFEKAGDVTIMVDVTGIGGPQP